MVNNVYIKNFKCFNELNLEFSNLNILVGTNSSGKSTVIQALLLVVNNITSKTDSPLNGHLVSLGSFSEARNFIKNARSFSIRISNNSENFEIEFSEDENDECKCEITKDSLILSEFLNYNNKKIHYLSAKRIGSQDLYNKNFDKYDQFGIFGEYAIDYLEKNKNQTIENYLIQEKSFGNTLGGQIDYWLTKILNSKIKTEDIKDVDKVKVSYSYNNNRYVRSKNIGSGLSYIISILVICLASKKGDIVIIENPEIHLHPKAQSLMTEFFVFVANAGVQLILETHSDHIFNGIRKFVAKRSISKEDVSINFFTMDEKSLSKHIKVELNDSGKILNYQKDLFDQFDNDLDEILGI